MEMKRDEDTKPLYVLPIENCGLLRQKRNKNSVTDESSESCKDIGGGTPIDDSVFEWERECPLVMGNLGIPALLHPSRSSWKCHVCNENVYKVATQEELTEHVEAGHCVMYAVPEPKNVASLRLDGPPLKLIRGPDFAEEGREIEIFKLGMYRPTDPRMKETPVRKRMAARMVRQQNLMIRFN